MLASPVRSDTLTCIVHDDYIFPSVDMIHYYLSSENLADVILTKRFNSLLGLITIKEKIESSRIVEYGQEDTDLKKLTTDILGSEVESLNEIYDVLYTVLHQYILNKCPDKAPEIAQNLAATQSYELELISRDELYNQTVSVLGTLSSRLIKYDSNISSQDLEKLVVIAVNQAKEKILTTPKKQEGVVLAHFPAYVPAYKDPVLLKRRQEIQDAIYAEDLARELQEQEDRDVALAMQDQDQAEEQVEHSDEESDAELNASQKRFR